MKRTANLTTTLLLLTALLASCGGTSTTTDTTDTTASAGGDTTAAEAEYVYPYPTTGYGGEEFVILNMDDMWNMHSVMSREESTGEALDDAIYDRNRLIEEKFDITLKEEILTETWEFLTVPGAIRTSVMSGDDAYDVCYVPLAGSSGLIADGCFYDLLEIDTIQLDKPWWYKSFNDAITIGGKLYGAAGGSNLLIHDGTRIMAFNYDLMDSLKLEKPYDLVREGKWTLDALNSYLTAAASLNGDASYAWNQEGKCTYGYSHNQENLISFIFGCGEIFFTKDGGDLVFKGANERFYNVFDKLSTVITTADGKVLRGEADDDMDPVIGGYIYAFKTGRSLFGMAEVNKFQVFRDLTFDYGVVPYPKYDEKQDRYYSNTWEGATSAFIPVTNLEYEKAAHILDAMAYEGEKSVIPTFRHISVEQKGLRNDDSIEMLGIVTDSLVPLYHNIFNVGTTMLNDLNLAVWDRTGAFASVVAANESTINTELEKIMENWQ
ncbi:MAG: hypothetical protein E7632_01200 [Ruminococcaceae bacterium]|nr:hypothetical protein [Oscillospiraceae bacterium]